MWFTSMPWKPSLYPWLHITWSATYYLSSVTYTCFSMFLASHTAAAGNCFFFLKKKSRNGFGAALQGEEGLLPPKWFFHTKAQQLLNNEQVSSAHLNRWRNIGGVTVSRKQLFHVMLKGDLNPDLFNSSLIFYSLRVTSPPASQPVGDCRRENTQGQQL